MPALRIAEQGEQLHIPLCILCRLLVFAASPEIHRSYKEAQSDITNCWTPKDFTPKQLKDDKKFHDKKNKNNRCSVLPVTHE